MDPQKNYVRFIVICITLLGSLSIAAGSYLILKGYQSGELLIANGGIAAISGLVGMLGVGKPSSHTPNGDTTKTETTKT